MAGIDFEIPERNRDGSNPDLRVVRFDHVDDPGQSWAILLDFTCGRATLQVISKLQLAVAASGFHFGQKPLDRARFIFRVRLAGQSGYFLP